MKKTLVKQLLSAFLFTLLSVFQTSAQTVDFNNYTPIESSGTLPEEFTSTSSEKYRESKKTISRKDQKAVRKAKDEFYLKSSFGIDDFLKSGKVLFNDPVGDYVNKVFEKVLDAAGMGSEQLKLFVVKTNYSNAFATDQGIIFITTGLLARLETEAQLSFVLSHELVHFIKKHSLDIFVKQKTGQKDFTSQNSENAIFSRAAYSKEKETEADEEGVKIFLKTGYTPQAAITVFDVLHYSYLPFPRDEFKRENFELPPFKWLNSLYIPTTKPVFADEEEDDAKSTHPNTFKRKEKMNGAVSGTGKDFLISEEEFNKIKKVCRYEYCRNALLERDYTEALYAAYSLLKENSESIYLKKIIAKSLYSLSTYLNQGVKNKLGLKYEDVQGDLQRVVYFFYKTQPYELATFNTFYLWRLKTEYPNDAEISTLLDESMFWLAYLHYPTLEKTTNVVVPDTLKDSSRYPSFKWAVREEERDTSFDEVNIRIKLNNYAYNYLLDNNSFLTLYKPAFERAMAEKGRIEKIYDAEKPPITLEGRKKTPGTVNEHSIMDYAKYDAVKVWERKKTVKDRKREFKGAFNNKLRDLDGEKIIFLNPVHYTIDSRKDDPIRYEAGEKTLGVFIDRLKESAKAAKVPFEMYSESNISVNDAALLNNIILLQEWISETMGHEDVRIIASDQDRINQLSAALNSRYVCIAGNIYNILEKNNAAAIFYSIVVPFYSWPFTIPYLLSKKVQTYYFMLMLDLKTGKTTTGMFSSVEFKNKQDISLVTFYDFMQKVKLEQQYNK